MPLGARVEPAAPAHGSSALRTLGWIGTGMLAAGATAAGALALKSSSDLQNARNTYPVSAATLQADADHTRTYSVLAEFSLTAAAVVIGAVTLVATLLAPSSAASRRPARRSSHPRRRTSRSRSDAGALRRAARGAGRHVRCLHGHLQPVGHAVHGRRRLRSLRRAPLLQCGCLRGLRSRPAGLLRGSADARRTIFLNQVQHRAVLLLRRLPPGGRVRQRGIARLRARPAAGFGGRHLPDRWHRRGASSGAAWADTGESGRRAARHGRRRSPPPSCLDPASGRGQIVVLSGSSNFPPLLAKLAPIVIASGYTPVYQVTSSCAGVASMFGDARSILTRPGTGERRQACPVLQ